MISSPHLQSLTPHQWEKLIQKKSGNRLSISSKVAKLAQQVLDQRKAEQSLYEFTKQAWHVLEPGKEFVDNWHIKAIAEHLEACTNPVNDETRGLREYLIKKLLINVPPGCMKSILVSVTFPAWVWGPNKQPDKRFLYASYDINLSTRDSVKCRDLIKSSWYQSRWGKVFKLTPDQNQKTKFENNQKGWRIATSVRGRGTGEHPDFIVVDDPHNAMQAESEEQRNAAIDWWTGTMPSRGVSREACRIMIMQRLHNLDLSGYVLENEQDWLHICLPMRFEADRMETTPLGFQDPRAQIGDLLWPELFDVAKVVELENTLGTRTAGQLQQRPPEHYEGAEWPASYFRESIWFEQWPDPADVILKVISLDPSKGATEKSDYQAYTKLLVKNNGVTYIEAVLVREDISKMVTRCFEMYVDFMPDYFVIEENFFQGMLSDSVEEHSRRAGFMIPVVEIQNRLNKIHRIRQLTRYLAEGELRFKAGDIGTALLVNQLKAFPGGLHDDGPDSLEMAVRTAREILLSA